MKKIPLTQGKYALVDDEDFERINNFKWVAARKSELFYAVRSSSVKKKDVGCENRHLIPMHRIVMRSPKGIFIDHVNGNGLDNRKSNLRTCTNSQNQMNKNKSTNNTSGFKGVTWDKSRNKWKAFITINGKGKHLGHFNDLKKAAIAYDKSAKKLFGEFSKLNFKDN